MGNPVSKSQEFMEQRERTNTEYRKQGTLSMNLVRTRSASSLHFFFVFVCRERSLNKQNAKFFLAARTAGKSVAMAWLVGVSSWVDGWLVFALACRGCFPPRTPRV